MTSLQEIVETGSDKSYLVVGDESALDELARNFQAKDSLTRIVRGDRCTRKAELFQEWSAALQFPSYFGANWDAFEECLNDFGWISDHVMIIILANVDRVLTEAPDDWLTLLSVLKAMRQKQRDASGQDHHAVHLFFHCKSGKEKRTVSRLKVGGIAVEKLTLEEFTSAALAESEKRMK